MKKIWIPVICINLFATACDGDEKPAAEAKPQVCKEGDLEIGCELKEGITALRQGLNSLPHFATDTISIVKLIDQYNGFVTTNQKTVDEIRNNASLSEKLSALTDAFEQNKALIDSLQFKATVMEQLESGTKDNLYVVSLSSGKQKHPTVFLKNKSKKYFHTATFQLRLVTRSKASIKEITWVQNTNGFEPAAFGAVFPPYFSGENKTIPIHEKLTEDEIKGWDSTEVKLINIGW